MPKIASPNSARISPKLQLKDLTLSLVNSKRVRELLEPVFAWCLKPRYSLQQHSRWSKCPPKASQQVNFCRQNYLQRRPCLHKSRTSSQTTYSHLRLAARKLPKAEIKTRKTSILRISRNNRHLQKRHRLKLFTNEAQEASRSSAQTLMWIQAQPWKNLANNPSWI